MDKWLWAVRIFKTRSIAAAACAAGKVRVQGDPVKPARSVRVGEVVTAATGEITRTIKVIGLIERRIGAKLVSQYVEDLTPPSEYTKTREPNFQSVAHRPKGAGRPTKKERRQMETTLIERNQ